MELPFAALHQLCAPMLDKRQGLPVQTAKLDRGIMIAGRG
jgi:hypothetical protein